MRRRELVSQLLRRARTLIQQAENPDPGRITKNTQPKPMTSTSCAGNGRGNDIATASAQRLAGRQGYGVR
jgi:hypothetical protein